jgi:hypothetical protein
MVSQLLKSQLTDDPIPFQPPPWINPVAVLAILGTLCLAVYIYMGAPLALTLAFTSAIATILWLKTTYHVFQSRRILPLYIFTILAQLVQGAEQHWGDYSTAVSVGWQIPISSINFTLYFTLTAVAFYLLGAAIIFYQTKLGGFITWWLFLWSIIYPASHFLLPLSTLQPEFTYIPGMISSPLLVILGIIGIRWILNDIAKRPKP